MITVTTKAANKVREIAAGEGLENQGLRLRVLGGGCSGFQYDLHLETEESSTDEVFVSEGIKIYVDMISYQYLEGTQVDYLEELYGAGFKFLNPSAKSTCGCGSSFST